MKTKILLLLLLLSVVSFVSAQEMTVTGTVTSAQDDMPLPGVNVIVKGTSRRTSTDFDGKYTITVNSGEVLEFRSIGLKTQTITVGDQTSVNVAMQEDAEALEEVVVIGFGTQKRSEVTGAISSVNSEDILRQPAANAFQSLQGKFQVLISSIMMLRVQHLRLLLGVLVQLRLEKMYCMLLMVFKSMVSIISIPQILRLSMY